MSDRNNNSSNRQVVYLFLGFLILFIFAFSLGVVVGKGLGGSQSWIAKKGESPKNLSEFKEPEKTPEAITKEKPIAEQTPALVEEGKGESETTKVGEEKKLSPSPASESIKTEAKKAVKKDIAVAPAGETQGKYTVQIGSSQKEEEAKKIVKSLISKGYPAFIKVAEIPGKGTWYRIRIGTFKTREEAELYRDNLKKDDPDIKSVLVKVND
ncbi:MAG: SPOR domain-containing protein [Ignavibacteriales bacterium]